MNLSWSEQLEALLNATDGNVARTKTNLIEHARVSIVAAVVSPWRLCCRMNLLSSL
uniref:Coiled-coil domain containing 163 n=1 Tax=Myotis myotis TaxID=51298 RepID=A0A7J7ZT21_MYOMY|nr:coiled-coil domain containing 163 [Myotis myotis]